MLIFKINCGLLERIALYYRVYFSNSPPIYKVFMVVVNGLIFSMIESVSGIKFL